jgi:retinol dehydrogenase 12
VAKIADQNVVQGHDLEMVTNCLSAYLLTILLEPILIRTAASSPPLSVRIVFVVAIMQLGTPAGGMSFDGSGNPNILPRKNRENYMQTKVGGTWLAAEFANRLKSKDILSVVSSSDDSQYD